MILNPRIDRVSFLADGTATLFSCAPLEVLGDGVVSVYDPDDVLISGDDYTVIGLRERYGPQQAASTFSIQFNTAPAAGLYTVVRAPTDLTQPVEFNDFGRWSPKVLEGALDRLALANSGNASGLSRTVRVSPIDFPIAPLPPVGERAGSLLAFDDEGQPIASSSNALGVLPVATTEVPGIVELANAEEAASLTDENRALTPARVPLASSDQRGIVALATQEEADGGVVQNKAITPATLGSRVTPGERNEGAEVSVRRFSPADVLAMIDLHANGGTGGTLTNEERLQRWVGTQAEYDALEAPHPYAEWLYIITDADPFEGGGGDAGGGASFLTSVDVVTSNRALANSDLNKLHAVTAGASAKTITLPTNPPDAAVLAVMKDDGTASAVSVVQSTSLIRKLSSRGQGIVLMYDNSTDDEWRVIADVGLGSGGTSGDGSGGDGQFDSVVTLPINAAGDNASYTFLHTEDDVLLLVDFGDVTAARASPNITINLPAKEDSTTGQVLSIAAIGTVPGRATWTITSRGNTPLNLARIVAPVENQVIECTFGTNWTITSRQISSDLALSTAEFSTFLRLAGGTMTGDLTLAGAPTMDLHAATKKYVDDNAGGGSSSSTGGGTTVLGGTREPLPTDGSDTDFWVAGLNNGSTLSISENVEGSWVELGRATDRDDDVNTLQHLTRDLHITQVTHTWSRVPDADGDMFATPPVNNAITLLDTDFDGEGTRITIPASSREQTTYVFVRLPAGTSTSGLRVHEDAQGDSTANVWGRAENEGVTIPSGDTYDYWMAVINLNETAEETWELQKRNDIDHTRYVGQGSIPAGGIEGQALVKSATTDYAVEWDTVADTKTVDDLAELTRDLHNPNPSSNWEDAADSDGDMYQSLASNTNALTDANFNGGGASVTIPGGQNASTEVYVRLPIGEDHTDYRILFADGFTRSREGNRWTAPTYPAAASTTYQYWRADGYTNYGGGTIKLQKRDATFDTTSFNGRLEGEARQQIADEIEPLQHLTRDLQVLAAPPVWENAANSDGDLFQTPAAVGTSVTLTDANFDNNGARIMFPEDQVARTVVFARLPAGTDRALYRVTFDGRLPRTGNTWHSVTGPSANTYDYYHVYAVDNYGNTIVQLQKRTNDLDNTRYVGEGSIPAGGGAGQALVKITGDDYDVHWGTVSGSGSGTDSTARTLARAAQATADAALPKAGGTMTGKIFLDGAPTALLHASTKKYVDDSRAVLRGFDELPNANDFEVGSIAIADDVWYKLAVTDDTEPDIFAGDVGREAFNNTSGEEWRGIATSQSPNGFSTDGEFTANPDNTLVLILASSSRHLRVVTKKSSYETAKGSAFATSDHIAVKVTMADGTTTDEAVLAYYNSYTRDSEYLIWQHRDADNNYNLYSEAAGNAITIEFFTVASNGTATTTPLFTHAAALKHWVLWPSEDPSAAGKKALVLAQANEARLDALDMHVDGIAEPIHSQTYDEDTALRAPTAGNAGDFAVSQAFNNILADDLLVVDWKKCEHLNDHGEYVVPGSDTDSGRMYFHPRNFDNTEWNGEFVYALDRAIQNDGSADTLNSWIVGSILYTGTTLTFGLHLQQGGTRTNRDLKPQAGFSLTLRIYRNSARAVPTSAPFKGIELGRLTGHATNKLGEQAWTSLATGVTTADGPDSGWSHWLSIPMYDYITLENGLGFILEMTRTGVTTRFSQIFLPWHIFGNWGGDAHGPQVFGGSWLASGTSNNNRIEIRGRINAGRIEFQAACANADTTGTLHAYIAT